MDVNELCLRLQELQRFRAVLIKSRVMQANRLQAIIAGALGYDAGMEEKDRLRMFREATKTIKAVMAGGMDHPYKRVIISTMTGIFSFEDEQSLFEDEMIRTAKSLPVAGWVEKPEQRGFGILSLATAVGEAGNLANYANPAKLWKRFGCAPHSFDGYTCMGQAWMRERFRPCKLPSEEWMKFGYSPRRRSIAYLFGENIVKQNKSIYRQRYDAMKARAAETHPDWTPKRCHLHGMLLATKELLLRLWCEWNQRPCREADLVTEHPAAALA